MLVTLVLVAVLQGGGTATVAQFSSYIRAERWDFTITDAIQEQSPAWVETDLSPPLPVRRAMAIASQQLDELVRDSERWRFNSITLRPVGSTGCWVYVVEYDEPPQPASGGKREL